MLPPDHIHDLPLPVTWDLMGELRRSLDPSVFMQLDCIHEDALLRTMFDAGPPADGRSQAALERWIRGFAPRRREWIAAAWKAVGDAGVTPLRVQALAVARTSLGRLRLASPVRGDLESALADAGPVLSRYGLARRLGEPLDSQRLRRLSTRFDYCVTAALLAEAGALWADLHLMTPLLCSEARLAATRLRAAVEQATPQPRAGVARVR